VEFLNSSGNQQPLHDLSISAREPNVSLYGLLSEFCHPDIAVLKQHFQWDGTQSVTFDAQEGKTALPVGASATLAALAAVSELLELSNETEIRMKVVQLLRKLLSSRRIK
jgi:hypothetical protein